MREPDADGSPRPAPPAAAIRHDPLPADDTVSGAPKRSSASPLDPLRERIACLTSQGGLTGVPQVNLPGATVDGAPVGLSIIARAGRTSTFCVSPLPSRRRPPKSRRRIPQEKSDELGE